MIRPVNQHMFANPEPAYLYPLTSDNQNNQYEKNEPCK
jgi:hypothetical protein